MIHPEEDAIGEKSHRRRSSSTVASSEMSFSPEHMGDVIPLLQYS